MNNLSQCTPFYVKNCSLTAIATGERAGSLIELRDKLLSVDEGCLYYHFWGSRMSSQYIHSQHHNDFASWAFHRLHDNILAEKLSIIDPIEFVNFEALRHELIETIENRLDDYDIVLWTKREDQFHFIRSTIIVFDSQMVIAQPEELASGIAQLPPSSIFYHFIDSRVRTKERIDDFSIWLKTFGDTYQVLIERILSLDPYFLSLTQLREELSNIIQNHFTTRKTNG